MSEETDSHVHAGLANLQPAGKDWSFGFCHAVEDPFHWGLGLYSKKCIYISKTKKKTHKTTKQTKQCKATTESKHQQKKPSQPNQATKQPVPHTHTS